MPDQFQISADRFASGMTYEQYTAQMTQRREEFVANELGWEIDPDDLSAFCALAQPLNVLVLDEDWCDDGCWMFPILGRLAAESGKLNIRVFLRDQHADLMDQCLNGEFRSIPVFVFLDADFNELGRFIERPASITQLREDGLRWVMEARPEFRVFETSAALASEQLREQVMLLVQAFTRQYTPLLRREVVRDLRMIVERANLRQLLSEIIATFPSPSETRA
jgi:hypothetical protein